MMPRMPCTIEPEMRTSDQIAATPIAPAPTKRTWCENTVAATSSIGPATPWLSQGSSAARAITAPSSIAMPVASPIRWPMPNTPSDSVPPKLVAPPRKRKLRAISPAATCTAVSTPKPAPATAPSTIVARPSRFSRAPSSLAMPTRRISAPAWPSGYGRSLSTTSARRSGTDSITPSTPPSALVSIAGQ